MDLFKFSVKDFVLYEPFQKWVLDSDDDTDAFWENWLQMHPEKWEEVEEARSMILTLHKGQEEDLDDRFAEVWDDINQTIDLEEEVLAEEEGMKVIPLNQPHSVSNRNTAWPLWGKAAGIAAGLLCILVSYYFLVQYDRYVEYKTEFGETKKVVLPDNSVVTLNANSTVKYLADWEEMEKREVWIEGEAFFSIVHTSDDQKFQVHSGNLDVEVLGTKFNVNNRRNRTQVTLSSGKIKLNIKTRDTIRNVIMNPGEFVEVSRNSAINKKTVDSEKYTSWRNNKLQFNNTPLIEIVEILEDNYGLQVELRDPALGNREFTAVYPADDLGILLQALAKSFDLNIIKKKNKISLEPKKANQVENN